MLIRTVCVFLLSLFASAATHRVMIRTVAGKVIEGDTSLDAVAGTRIERILSIHSGAPASAAENGRIIAGIAAIQGQDRKASDLAVEELTAIGLPLLTPLLTTYKDTDQHEPRPLYRLFERIMPSYADGFDRSLSLIRLQGGAAMRVALPANGSVDIKTADGMVVKLGWDEIRMLAVRQKVVSRTVAAHSIRHSTQIEYLDTGVALTAGSKLDAAARGFVRLSWDTDSWASDADGLTKPGSPAYKSHLVDGHPFGALVGRIGAAGEVFFLGKKAAKTGIGAGRLGLAVNDNRHWQNNLGSFYVTLSATDAYDLGDAQ